MSVFEIKYILTLEVVDVGAVSAWLTVVSAYHVQPWWSPFTQFSSPEAKYSAWSSWQNGVERKLPLTIHTDTALIFVCSRKPPQIAPEGPIVKLFGLQAFDL